MSQDSTKAKLSEEQSVEIPNSGGARKSKLVTSGDTILFAYENLTTTWDAIQQGKKVSENGKCLGWRSSESGYSWITYAEFIKRAENFGSGLRKIGLNPGQSSNVGIYAKNSIEWVVAQYGIWSQSAILVPLYDTLGSDASTFMINQADVHVVICDQEEKVRRLITKKSETPLLNHVITMTAASQELKNLAKENGINLQLFSEVEDIGENCSTPLMGDSVTSKEDTMISFLPMAHIFELMIQLVMFMSGGSIGFYSGDINKLGDDMSILKPTIFPGVPRLLNKLYDKAQALIQSKLKLDQDADISTKENEAKSICKPFKDSLGGRIRIIVTGAAPIYGNVIEFYTKIIGCKIMEAYGQTECSGPCTFVLFDSDYTGDVGSPVPCCIIKLVDVPEMGYYSKDLKGEICIKGSGVFKGYLKDPKKTADALDNDAWLHSGDIGMWLSNGTLKIIDRKKNILKLSQGVYVAPEKIECIYLLSPYVSQIFVHGNSLKSVLVAIIVPEKEILLPWCKQNLKKHDSWTEICKDPSVQQFIFEDITRIGNVAGLLSFEQVKYIHLHPKIFTYEDGFLTPTTKLKREVCKKYFNQEIAHLTNTGI